jgi:hypothetical protein
VSYECSAHFRCKTERSAWKYPLVFTNLDFLSLHRPCHVAIRNINLNLVLMYKWGASSPCDGGWTTKIKCERSLSRVSSTRDTVQTTGPVSEWKQPVDIDCIADVSEICTISTVKWLHNDPCRYLHHKSVGTIPFDLRASPKGRK